jgi:hypothetical protein
MAAFARQCLFIKPDYCSAIQTREFMGQGRATVMCTYQLRSPPLSSSNSVMGELGMSVSTHPEAGSTFPRLQFLPPDQMCDAADLSYPANQPCTPIRITTRYCICDGSAEKEVTSQTVTAIWSWRTENASWQRLSIRSVQTHPPYKISDFSKEANLCVDFKEVCPCECIVG